MFVLRRPSEEAIRVFLAEQAQKPFSYRAIGETRTSGRPSGYVIDHNRVLLGQGEALFHRAVCALQQWRMCETSLYTLYAPDPPVQADQTVCLCAPTLGLWSLNACRVVYTLEERGPLCRCAFAYGTLEHHAEEGEERFMVEWNQAEDTVWYDIYAFSRPGHLFTLLGYPLARSMQKQFARESKQAMMRAVQDSR